MALTLLHPVRLHSPFPAMTRGINNSQTYSLGPTSCESLLRTHPSSQAVSSDVKNGFDGSLSHLSYIPPKSTPSDGQPIPSDRLTSTDRRFVTYRCPARLPRTCILLSCNRYQLGARRTRVPNLKSHERTRRRFVFAFPAHLIPANLATRNLSRRIHSRPGEAFASRGA